MKHISKASSLYSLMRKRQWSQHEPNTITPGHNDDQPESWSEDKTGQHPRSVGKTSEYDWSQHPYEYHWNSLGLRGPEPNKDAPIKMLVIGNSFSLGTGVPLEKSHMYLFAKHFNIDYINLSDNYVLTDSIAPAKEIMDWYKPTFIYLTDMRYIDTTSTLIWLLQKDNTLDRKTFQESIYDVMTDGLQHTVSLFEDMIRLHAPQAKVVWDICIDAGKRSKIADNFSDPKIHNHLTFDVHKYSNESITLDLGRDNKHPGIIGNQKFADRLINEFGQYVR
tara:strand:- start:960 stop:1793 length:834 start_codon:yes stop_codon:yes gene_type:complete